MTRTLLAVVILSMAFAASASAAGPAAHSSKACSLSISQQRNAGATYLVELRVSGTTCSSGLKVEKAWQACRRATAGKMTCRKRVLGYSCKQTILGTSKKQYDARVTCTAGSKIVKFIYTQNR